MKKDTVILFDVDGTLLNSRTGHIEASTKKMLQALHDQGYFLALCTGRSLGACQATKIDQLIPWDGYVVNNGHLVLDQHFNVIAQFPYPKEKAQRFIQRAKELGIGVLGQGNSWYLFNNSADVAIVHQHLKTACPPLVEYSDQIVYTFLIYGQDYSLVDEFDDLEAIEGFGFYADIVQKGYNKASGVQALLNTLHCHHLITFGDSLNDHSTFEIADESIAMFDAHDELKQIATYVVTSPVDEIQQGVEYLKLLEEK